MRRGEVIKVKQGAARRLEIVHSISTDMPCNKSTNNAELECFNASFQSQAVLCNMAKSANYLCAQECLRGVIQEKELLTQLSACGTIGCQVAADVEILKWDPTSMRFSNMKHYTSVVRRTHPSVHRCWGSCPGIPAFVFSPLFTWTIKAEMRSLYISLQQVHGMIFTA